MWYWLQTSKNKRQTKRVATQFFKHMEMIITRTPENIMPDVQARKQQK
jgi:ribosomal protein S8